MDLSLNSVGVTDDLDPALDTLPVEHARRIVNLVCEKVERLWRDGTVCRLKGQRSGNVCASVQRFLWTFQGITC